MAPGDDVQLPDLQVIQRYSLAVRGASAPAADVIEALQADLAWLTGTARRRTAERASNGAAAAEARTASTSAPKTPAKKAATTSTPAKKAAPAKRSAAANKAATTRTQAKKKAPAKKSGARRA